ncbi:MAG: Dabb family protein [Prolixibacteraceae bacterium]|nr:Dabb family protein [Prolixibacteraceae bacterium]
MIKHIVLFKLKEYSSEKEKKIILKKMEEKLMALKETITELKYIEVGPHIDINSQSYDLCLITHFDSVEALDIYRVHPDHKKVVSYIMDVTVSRAAVDFEV